MTIGDLYRVDVYQFNTVAACISYKRSQMINNAPDRLDTSSYDRLIFGREIKQ